MSKAVICANYLGKTIKRHKYGFYGFYTVERAAF